MTAAFDAEVLASLDAAGEVSIETGSGERRYRTVIWVVVASEQVYVRSYRGPSGRWYQRALADDEVALIAAEVRIDARAVHVTDDETIEAVSAQFVDKYPPGRSVDAMVVPEVLGTTLRLDPVRG